jgi:metal-responsive CopG/Arc/MetJ family transcriptional regulator
MLGRIRRMGAGRRMVAKLAEVVRRINLVAPEEWLRRIDRWRKHQTGLPNRSEAIRRLTEIGLDTEAKRKGDRQ